MPRPLNMLWYSPLNTSSTTWRVTNSIWRTLSRISFGIKSGHLYLIEYLLYDILGCALLRLRFIGEDNAVTQHVHADVFHILRSNVSPATDKRIGPGRQGQVNCGPWTGP